MKKSVIEKACESLGLLKTLEPAAGDLPVGEGEFSNYPPPDRWDDWEEYEATEWAQKKKKRYSIIPTSCFNCESGCGLLSYVDKETGKVRKFEGNPYHPGSRGRNCAKGHPNWIKIFPQRIRTTYYRSDLRRCQMYRVISLCS